MISDRFGPMPRITLRCETDIRFSLSASLRITAVGVRSQARTPGFSSSLKLDLVAARAATASAAAVPEVANTLTRSHPICCSARSSSRRIHPCMRAISSPVGGSWRRNSRVRRTAPRGRLTIWRIALCSEKVTSQLPPPRSTNRQRPRAAGSLETTPRWIRRPSSRPEIISTFQPVAECTHDRNAC